jgi:hypothetical protein
LADPPSEPTGPICIQGSDGACGTVIPRNRIVAGKEEQVAPVRSPDSDKSKEASPSPSKWFLARIDFAQRVVCARSVSKAADS